MLQSDMYLYVQCENRGRGLSLGYIIQLYSVSESIMRRHVSMLSVSPLITGGQSDYSHHYRGSSLISNFGTA